MDGYYHGWRARSYDAMWRTFTRRTLAAVIATIDCDALRGVPARLGRPPRVLDVGCGTGILLGRLLERVPELDASGVDASADMLAQARVHLRTWPAVRLERARVGAGTSAGLPFAPGGFDLITCANLLHYLPEPVATLGGFARLLAPGGQLVVEDFARRAPPFPWHVYEWLLRRLDSGHVRAYSLAEAHALCARATLQVAFERAFAVDWLWHAWALRALATSESRVHTDVLCVTEARTPGV
jgi:SAM-dependent methyltransferase